MKKYLLILSMTAFFTSNKPHVLDDVIAQCSTQSNDLSLSQKISEYTLSSLAGACIVGITGSMHYSINPNVSKKWIPVHIALGTLVGYIFKDALRYDAKPECYAASILTANPLYGQILNNLDLPVDEFVHKMGETFSSNQEACTTLISLKSFMLSLIKQMNGIPKYNGPDYRNLLHSVQNAVTTLQKGERAIIKTENWFLEKINAYEHIYNLLQTYDNQQFIDALINCYNGTSYPHVAAINGLIKFQNELRSINKTEYSPQDFLELRKRNLNLIEILQKIIVVIENSYEYKTERKIAEQADKIEALRIKSLVQDVHTIYLYEKNNDLQRELSQKERDLKNLKKT